jgi:hypothetical protein
MAVYAPEPASCGAGSMELHLLLWWGVQAAGVGPSTMKSPGSRRGAT